MDVSIPANTTATVYVPVADGSLITESGHLLNAVKELSVEGVEEGYLIVGAGSGVYHFTVSQ